jgi:hypothetical protein
VPVEQYSNNVVVIEAEDVEAVVTAVAEMEEEETAVEAVEAAEEADTEFANPICAEIGIN